MDPKSCYYHSFGSCSCTYSAYGNKGCPKEGCPCFVSESDYFDHMMKGTLDTLIPKKDARQSRLELEARLRPAKTKGQKKWEEKQNRPVKKEGDSSGFSLGDDPAFKKLFGNKT